MPKTPNHGLWGSLAVAGLTAAVQTTRHNNKSAELKSTERLLKVMWRFTFHPILLQFEKYCYVHFPEGILDEMVVHAMERTKIVFSGPSSPANEEDLRCVLMMGEVLCKVAMKHVGDCTYHAEDGKERLLALIADQEQKNAKYKQDLLLLAASRKQTAASSPGTVKATDPQGFGAHELEQNYDTPRI